MADLEEEDGIEKLLSKLKEREDYWNKTIDVIKGKLMCSVKDVIPVQAEAISLRQILTEQIKSMSYEIYKLIPKMHTCRKQIFEYYAGAKAPYITNASERNKLVEWDMALHDQRKNVLDEHINFLRETMRNVDNINYSIKNKITILQLTDME